MKSDKEIRGIAERLLSDYNTHSISLDQIVSIIANLGYEIIDYHHSVNPPEVEMLLNRLNLREYAKGQNAFAYAAGQTKIVFICEILSEEEKLIALAHELGHIVCGHLENGASNAIDVAQEYEANEFSHYLFHPTIQRRIVSRCQNHKLLVASILALMVAACSVFGFFTHQEHEKYYHGDYYVTESGERFHNQNCFYIAGKPGVHRMTEQEYESGKYKPCKVCIPVADG